ncbi:unnamed protein product [Brassica oleracea]
MALSDERVTAERERKIRVYDDQGFKTRKKRKIRFLVDFRTQGIRELRADNVSSLWEGFSRSILPKFAKLEKTSDCNLRLVCASEGVQNQIVQDFEEISSVADFCDRYVLFKLACN